MDRATCLDTAKAAVSQRPKAYGEPEDNFTRIALLWNAYFRARDKDVIVSLGDVATLMCLMKIARLANSPGHADSWIDLAGYAACGAEVTRC